MDNNNNTNTTTTDEEVWLTITLQILAFIIMIGIIVASIFSNLLVIVSVMRHRKLRIITNYFVVSLAFADMLIALLVMTFNFSVQFYGKWLFGEAMCDFWNSMDVYLSTVSINHLCCISVERYFAIVKPFKYIMYMTKKVVAYMLILIWVVPSFLLISIYLGWYTTEEYLHSEARANCQWIVNKPYALISSIISFGIPCTIMTYTSLVVFKVANKQEKAMYNRQANALLLHQNNTNRNMLSNSEGSSKKLTLHEVNQDLHNTPIKDCNISKMKREHKAAITLSIKMGVFILCWLPFFMWYVTTTICNTCWNPSILVAVVFWIGYFNSALNPVIYAYFNKNFREAFKNTLKWIFCSYCQRRPSDLDALDVRRR